MLPDDQLRAMVREAIARHAGSSSGRPDAHPRGAPVPVGAERRHASHLLLAVTPGSAADGACVIEPSVACTHCGYCQSYGH